MTNDRPAPTTMTVRVCDRSSWSYGRTVPIVTVTILAVCPRCGGPRGKPVPLEFREFWYGPPAGRRHYLAHRWFNPCGHIDLHQEVVAEARRMEEA